MTIYKFATPCDPTATTLEHAATEFLGSPRLSELIVFGTETNRVALRKLQGEYGFDLTIVPDWLATGRYFWGVRYGNNSVVSEWT